MMQKHQWIQNLRTHYRLGELASDDCAPDPVTQFADWFAEVMPAHASRQEDVKIEENAFVLSTVDDNGHPASRVLLLKEFSERGFVFFSNYDSRKAHEIDNNPNVALLFMWQHIEKQVRIEGTAKKLSADESDAYFATRARASQLGAWASKQSEVITDRKALEDKYDALAKQYEGQPVPRPSNWGGYIVEPQYFEFWKGRDNRLHDRFAYLQRENSAGWDIVRLSP